MELKDTFFSVNIGFEHHSGTKKDWIWESFSIVNVDSAEQPHSEHVPKLVPKEKIIDVGSLA